MNRTLITLKCKENGSVLKYRKKYLKDKTEYDVIQILIEYLTSVTPSDIT